LTPLFFTLKGVRQFEGRSDVGAVQKALSDLGYDVPVTDFYGKKTETTIKQFQEHNGLAVDGVFKQADFERIDQLISVKEQSMAATQSIATPPANQPDATAPTVSPEQSKQVEQMVSVLSTNPTFAALAPDVQMAMAAQMMEAAQAVNLQPPVQAQTQTVTPQVHTAPEPITQTAVPTMATTAMMAQAEPQPVQPVMTTPVQSSPVYAAPAMTAPPVATAEVEPPNRQTETVSQSAQPIVLPHNLASLHAQLTEKFGNQLDHLSEKDQQTAIALATHEATRNMARSVDYVQINKDGDVMMGFDGHKGFSAEMNLKQVQNNEAGQVLAASMDLQQTQAQNLAVRQVSPTIH
jgi:peptidoglycan hydrolase-like protein with peptidoglycan-binding domain